MADVDDEQQPKDAAAASWVEPTAQVATNATTALAGAVFGPPGAAVAAAASPLITKLFDSLGKRHVAQRDDSGRRVLAEAAATLGGDPEELASRIGDDPARLLLAGATIDAGCRTINADKIRALGRALAAGVQDDALVDPQMLIVAALADMEAPHVKVLRHVAEVYPGSQALRRGPQSSKAPAWAARALREALPEVASVLAPVLTTLERHALVDVDTGFGGILHKWQREVYEEVRAGDPFGLNRGRRLRPSTLMPQRPDPTYSVTEFGRAVLQLLRAAQPADED